MSRYEPDVSVQLGCGIGRPTPVASR